MFEKVNWKYSGIFEGLRAVKGSYIQCQEKPRGPDVTTLSMLTATIKLYSSYSNDFTICKYNHNDNIVFIYFFNP
jgi:hypothetical protein